jgi:hypothetical protein
MAISRFEAVDSLSDLLNFSATRREDRVPLRMPPLGDSPKDRP